MLRNTMTKVSFATLVIMLFSAGISFAQQAITCFGGDMSGSTGSVSYSGGEVAVRYATARAITVVNVTESISEGVQQPFTERDRQSQGIESLAVNLLIYPNPTADNVVMECDPAAGQLTYTLYNTAGQVLQQGTYNGGQQLIDLEQYVAGNYMLKVSSKKKKKMNIYKIIKAK